MKIPPQLQSLLSMGVISEVIQPLMSGKEAQVYLVRYSDEVCVVKVYKEVNNRSFRQRSVYAEGRKTRNSRDKRALEKSGRYGKELEEESWKNAEVDRLYALSKAGVRVPRPLDYFDGVLIMEMVVDADGNPAPRLSEMQWSDDKAENEKIFHIILKQIVLMLCAGVVHGDLSEYNILMAHDGPVIIDFPQALDASANQNAKAIFIRDVHNLTLSLAKYVPALKNADYAQEIWELYENSRLKPSVQLTGIWKDRRKTANVNAVLNEIEEARLDHIRKQRIKDGKN
jgi:RIO kinase 1